MAERFVVLGLARARATWFRDVGRWAVGAAVPVEFVRAVSVDEVRARLRSGRPFSALLVDAGLTGVDRDLVELAAASACAVLVVDDGRPAPTWRDPDANLRTLPPSFGRDDLLDALRAVAQPVRTTDVTLAVETPGDVLGEPGRLVAVTGPAGCGRSTVAMALAQGTAGSPEMGGPAVDREGAAPTVLADLCLHADLGLFHDAPDVMPAVTELVEAHRVGRPSPAEVRALCWHVDGRGYDLLLGLRRRRDWAGLRPRSFAAALDGLRRAYATVVADVDADVDGEATTGSHDVEERNCMARTTLLAADVVLIVGGPTLVGLRGLARVVDDLRDLGVTAGALVPVVNRSPRSPRARAALVADVARLAARPGRSAASGGLAGPVLVPDRRGVESSLRDVSPVPAALAAPLVAALRALAGTSATTGRAVARTSATTGRDDGGAWAPVRVEPGSLGSYGPDDEGVA